MRRPARAALHAPLGRPRSQREVIRVGAGESQAHAVTALEEIRGRKELEAELRDLARYERGRILALEAARGRPPSPVQRAQLTFGHVADLAVRGDVLQVGENVRVLRVDRQ